MMTIDYGTAPGFENYWGESGERYEYIQSKLSSYFKLCGFNKLKIAALEKQMFFSSEFVGTNPWPDWHPKSLFTVFAKNYDKAYEEVEVSDSLFFLIPEGTTSVCRWVANEISKDEEFIQNHKPIKIYYTPLCFRNELISKISPTKKREFTQVGVEYLGLADIHVDIEILYMMAKGLMELGFSPSQIRIRVSDVRLFNQMIERHGLNTDNRNTIKKLLDKIASARARAQEEELSKLVEKLDKFVESLELTEEQRKAWSIFYMGYLGSGKLNIAKSYLSKEVFDDLSLISNFFKSSDFELVIDPSIVRSQDYYNGITFQADLKLGSTIISEVGGGGRYDYFVNRLFSSDGDPIMPATGYAYSIERILAGYDVAGVGVEGKEVKVRYGTGVDYIIPRGDLISAIMKAEELRAEDKQVDIYLASDDKKNVTDYAKKRNAEIIW